MLRFNITLNNTLALCGIIFLKQENIEGFYAQKRQVMKNAVTYGGDSLRFLTADVEFEY
jgi:hypothetical protein